MKIVHICLNGTFNYGWNYQDNLITKYQAKQGHEVSIICSEWMWNKEGDLECVKCDPYINDDGVRIIRIPMYFTNSITKKFRIYKGLISKLEVLEPNIVFIHGVASL